MTASKLIGGLKSNGWVRREFNKRVVDKHKKEQQAKWREELRDDITRGSHFIRK